MQTTKNVKMQKVVVYKKWKWANIRVTMGPGIWQYDFL